MSEQEELQATATAEVAQNTQAPVSETPTLDTEELTLSDDGTNTSGEVMMVADADDASRAAVFKQSDFGDVDEDAIRAAMLVGDEIRSSTTVPTGEYIVSLKPVRYGQDIVMTGTYGADGSLVPGRMKSIGFRYAIHYDMKGKTMMSDNGYQTFYTARKDGSVFANGLTDYKQFCAAATAAVLEAENPGTNMSIVMKHMDAKKIVPVDLFNQVAASTDDNIIYFRAKILEKKGDGEHGPQNVLVGSSLKDDKGYYNQLLNS